MLGNYIDISNARKIAKAIVDGRVKALNDVINFYREDLKNTWLSGTTQRSILLAKKEFILWLERAVDVMKIK